MILIFIGLLVLAGVGLLVLNGKRSQAWRRLEIERESSAKKREEIVFYLEMARALATGEKVYVVEAGDVEVNYWRRHTFFLNRDDAESYAESISLWGGQLLAPFTRIREITAADLPPTPYPVRPLKGQDPAEQLLDGHEASLNIRDPNGNRAAFAEPPDAASAN